jgi:trigger factor
MTIEQQDLDNGQVKLTIEVSVAESEPYLDRATDRLAAKHQIPGFRPGKAPRPLIRQTVGDVAVYEEATQEIVSKTLYDALKERTIDSVGRPDVHIEKLAPGNPIVFSATVSVMPSVTLSDWRSVTVSRQQIVVADKEVDDMVEELRSIQAKEAAVMRPAQNGDRVEVNFEVKRDGVVIEGGTAIKYPLFLGKGSMIPGFEEQIVGLKQGDVKDFTLTFPKEYYEASLAGVTADFHVTVVTVFERTLPEMTDDWAHKVAERPLKELLALLRENLEKEKQDRERVRLEQAIIDAIIDASTFGPVPDVLRDAEIDRIFVELEDDIRRRRMTMEQYLQSLKKTKDELREDFKPMAIKRVKGALVLRTLAKELAITVGSDEIEEEIRKQQVQYKDFDEVLKEMQLPDFKRYVERILVNRNVIDNLVSLLAK